MEFANTPSRFDVLLDCPTQSKGIMCVARLRAGKLRSFCQNQFRKLIKKCSVTLFAREIIFISTTTPTVIRRSGCKYLAVEYAWPRNTPAVFPAPSPSGYFHFPLLSSAILSGPRRSGEAEICFIFSSRENNGLYNVSEYTDRKINSNNRINSRFFLLISFDGA